MTRQRILLVSCAITFLFTCGSSSHTYAESFDNEGKELDDFLTLRGFTGMGILVNVDPCYPYPSNTTLSTFKSQVQTDVELKLRIAGIKIYPDFVWMYYEESRPQLQVFVYVWPKCAKLHPCFIEVKLFQLSDVINRPWGSVFSPTWSWSGHGAHPSLADIRDTLKDIMDMFINDYLKANPGPR